MIVVDTNLVAYLLLPGEYTALAEQVYARDPVWYAPLLWRSELRNVLLQYVRHNQLPLHEAHDTFADAVRLLQPHERAVEALPVLERAVRLGCSAYDAEYVALAEEIMCTLVTADKRLVAAASHVAISLTDFASSGP